MGSLQGELIEVLRDAAGVSIAEGIEIGLAWRKKFGKRFSDSAAMIRRDQQR